ncbi:MAG: tannase/feruloyl esterase family alpha/beta hydrolase [Longimicrobiales bacterium]
MKTQRLIRHGLRDMGRHRLRTFFMMLGTFVGVLALTVVLAIGQGTRDAVTENIERMFAGNSILLSAGGGGMMGGAREVSRTRPLCVYPKQARYNGSGDVNDAANFTCVDPEK